MGTVTFDLAKYGTQRGTGAATLRGELVSSGAHTTSTSASSLTDGAAGAGSAITARRGEVLRIRGDEDMRLKFGGDTATATSGFILYADETSDLEVSATGAVSIIDVA